MTATRNRVVDLEFGEGFDGEQPEWATPPEDEELLDNVLEKIVGPDGRTGARFKLEVMFLEDRSTTKPYIGTVFAWTNGGFMHGGGDESVYFCPTQLEGGDQCFHPIDVRFLADGHAVCTKCERVHKPRDLIGQVRARLHTQGWAELLTRVFYSLGQDADIRVGHFRGDIRRATQLEMHDAGVGGEELAKVHKDHVWITYPNQDLMKDLSAGSDVYQRIKALLSA